jgi:hypothetical protein
MSPEMVTTRSRGALGAADGERVEQRLRGVLVRPVARVDDARAGVARDEVRRAEAEWRTTNTSGCMASRFFTVSRSVSPLLTLDVETEMLTTSAERRLPASSKLVRVRVLASKKRLITVLPRSVGTLRTRRARRRRRPPRCRGTARCRAPGGLRCRGGGGRSRSSRAEDRAQPRGGARARAPRRRRPLVDRVDAHLDALAPARCRCQRPT